MDHDHSSRSALSITTLVILAAAAGGVFLYERPFEIFRPPVEESRTRPTYSSQHVDARLWQDPFEPARRHAEELERNRRGSADKKGSEDKPTDSQFFLTGLRTPWPVAKDDDVRSERLPQQAQLFARSGNPLVAFGRSGASATNMKQALKGMVRNKENLSPGKRFQNWDRDRAHSLIQLTEEIHERFPRRKVCSATDPALLVLPVMVPGGVLPEEKERRRRVRSALLLALAHRSYVPEEERFIGFVQTEVCLEGSTQPGEYRPPLLLPFEWFRRDDVSPLLQDRGPARVLVLWINENRFRQSPLGGLDCVLGRIIGSPWEHHEEFLPPAEIGPCLDVRLVGPASSTLLREMVRRSPYVVSPCGHLTDELLRYVDSYLDRGIPDEADHDGLRNRVSRVVGRACLDENADLQNINKRLQRTLTEGLHMVQDSNQEWAQFISNQFITDLRTGPAFGWESYGQRVELDDHPEELETLAKSLLRWGRWDEQDDEREDREAGQFVAFVDRYLDDGLSDDEAEERVIQVLGPLLAVDDPNLDEIAKSLEDELSVQDSDPEWAVTVATAWAQNPENPGQRLLKDHLAAPSPAPVEEGAASGQPLAASWLCGFLDRLLALGRTGEPVAERSGHFATSLSSVEESPRTGSSPDVEDSPGAPTRQPASTAEVKKLVDLLDSYLDTGLPDDLNRSQLEQSLAPKVEHEDPDPDAIAQFLSDQVDVQDSDPNWAATVSRVWSENPNASGDVLLEQAMLMGAGLMNDSTGDRGRFDREGAIEDLVSALAAVEREHLTEGKLAFGLRRYLARIVDRHYEKPYEESRDRINPRFESGDEQAVDPRIEPLIGEWLAALAAENGLNQQPLRVNRSILEGLPVYSPLATASDNFLLPPAGSEESAPRLAPRGGIEDLLRAGSGIEYHRTVLPDDRMAEALIEEIGRRGVDVADPQGSDYIVLVSEWDTVFGRALPATFSREIHCRRRGSLDQTILDRCRRGTEAITPTRVYAVRYLRGLDGRVPGGGGDHSAGGFASRGGGDGSKGESGALEQPFGTSQLDQVRHLSQRLVSFERQIKTESHRARIGAIGVLGSDVYDKQLILQALRKKFPDAVFFTTDLDARLLHPNQYKWSRNLIIASSHDLLLPPRSSRVAGAWSTSQLWTSAVPFRDSYQTATFLAGLGALGATVRESGGWIQVIDDEGSFPVVPRLFEVARSGAYEITPDLERQGLEVRGRFDWWSLFKMGVLGVLLGGIVLLAAPGLRSWFMEIPGWKTEEKIAAGALVLLGVAIFMTMVFVILISSTSGEGEPFEWLEGVSAWPTEILRVTAAYLGICFLVIAPRVLSEKERSLAEKFGLPEERPKWKWRGSADPASDGDEDTCEKEGSPSNPVPMARVWMDYLRAGHPRPRAIRVATMTLLFWAVGGALMMFQSAPTRPLRGALAFQVDTLVLHAGVLAVLASSFYVLDVVVYASRYILTLARCYTKWPEETRKKRGKEVGLVQGPLSEYLEIDLVARHTRVIGRLLPWPFLLLFLMVASRARYFDNWDWPPALLLIIALIIGFSVAGAGILRYGAERLRKRDLRRLRKHLASLLLVEGDEDSEVTREAVRESPEQVRVIIDMVEHERYGAFAPITQHPVIRALLIPFGGVGIVALLDMLSALGV